MKILPTDLAQVRSIVTQPIVRRREVDLRIVPLGFLLIILAGTFLLRMPAAHAAEKSISLLDAFSSPYPPPA